MVCLIAVCSTLWALTGCIQVEYIGQNFPELPDSSAVMIFEDANTPPAGEFQAIGKAKLNIPPDVDMVSVREKITEIAREHGASAARIVSVEKRLVNRYYGAAREEAASSTLTDPAMMGPGARQPDGSLAQVNSFGEVVTPNRTYRARYEHVVKVQLLMPAKEYARLLELRRKAAEQE